MSGTRVKALAVAAALLGALMAAPQPQVQAATVVPVTAVSSRTAPARLVDTNPLSTMPVILDGRPQALAEVNGHMIVGGTFTKIKDGQNPTVLTQPYLFSYDIATGLIDQNFRPVLDRPVQALVAGNDGATVFVGGLFTKVNGLTRPWLAKLNIINGALDNTFNAGLNGQVSGLDRHGGTIFAVGWFSRSRTTPRGGLVYVSSVTGQPYPGLDLPLASTRSGYGVRTVDVTPDAQRLIIGGQFTSVGGVPRDQLAVIDLSTFPATVRADWNTNSMEFACRGCTASSITTYLRDVDVSPDGRYFVVGNTFYRPGYGDALLRFEVNATGADIAPTWYEHTGTDTITSVKVTADHVVYVGGHFRWLGATQDGPVPGRTTRYGLAAVDGYTGVPYDWAPTRARGYGVLAMEVDSRGALVVANDTAWVAGELHPRMAVFPSATGRDVAGSGAVPFPAPVTMYASGQSYEFTHHADGYSYASAGATGVIPGFRAGASVGSSLMVATQEGLFRMIPGPSRTWSRGERLYLTGVDPATLTGMAVQDDVLYFTIAGNPNLHAVGLNPDGLLMSQHPTVVGGPGLGIGRDFTTVTGMFAVGGYLYVGLADGRLERSPLGSGQRFDPFAAATVVSAPWLDGGVWSRPMHLGSRLSPVTDDRLNLALNKPARQSEDNLPASRAVDGNRDGDPAYLSLSSTFGGLNRWWEVDLGASVPIRSVRLWGRAEAYQNWLNSPWIFVSDTPFASTDPVATVKQPGVRTYRIYGIPRSGQSVRVWGTGRYVRVQVPGLEYAGLQLGEVEVFAS